MHQNMQRRVRLVDFGLIQHEIFILLVREGEPNPHDLRSANFEFPAKTACY